MEQRLQKHQPDAPSNPWNHDRVWFENNARCFKKVAHMQKDSLQSVGQAGEWVCNTFDCHTWDWSCFYITSHTFMASTCRKYHWNNFGDGNQKWFVLLHKKSHQHFFAAWFPWYLSPAPGFPLTCLSSALTSVCSPQENSILNKYSSSLACDIHKVKNSCNVCKLLNPYEIYEPWNWCKFF